MNTKKDKRPLHLVDTDHDTPSEGPGLTNSTRQAAPPAPADQSIPTPLGTERPHKHLHIRPEAPASGLVVHLGGSRAG